VQCFVCVIDCNKEYIITVIPCSIFFISKSLLLFPHVISRTGRRGETGPLVRCATLPRSCSNIHLRYLYALYWNFIIQCQVWDHYQHKYCVRGVFFGSCRNKKRDLQIYWFFFVNYFSDYVQCYNFYTNI